MILLKNKIKLISGEKGLALPLVIIVMVVLFILGTALLQYATTEAVQVAQSEKRMQAYYLARSGAEAMAEHLIEDPSLVSQYIGETGVGSIPNSGGDFTVLVEEDADGNIRIVSTGSVDDSNERLVLTLQLEGADLEGIFNSAIYSNPAEGTQLDISSFQAITGDIRSTTSINYHQHDHQVDWDIGQGYEQQSWVFTEPVPPV